MTVAILKRDNKNLYIFVVDGDSKDEAYNQAWVKLQKIQPSSCDHALKYEGYSIEVN